MGHHIIKRIQNWYKINCNGDWEHSYGLNITNLDNPGWGVTIDLEGTPFDYSVYEKSFDNGEDDWMTIKVKNKKFEGRGDPNKLLTIFEIFLDDFVPNHGDPDFYYDIYEPIIQNGKFFYKRLKGKIRTEDTFEIIEVPDLNYKELRSDDFDDLAVLNFDDIKDSFKLKTGDVVKCDLKRLAGCPTVIVTG